MKKCCEICGTEFTKRRPNSCQPCYFKKRHQERYQKKLRKCLSCDQEFYLGHNIYCDDCKDNILKCDEKHRIYFGRKFYKSENGYWVCTKAKMPWAHRWVWINAKGTIPKDMDVHHIDRNKDNNEIENLAIMSRSDHLLLHSKDEKDKERLLKQLKENKHKSIEWLKSEEGREKQRQGALQSWKKRKS